MAAATAPTEHCWRNGQIPAFGDWESVNQLPITQFFDCARQAGLLRCTCSSAHCGAANGPAFPPSRLYASISKGSRRVKEQTKKVEHRCPKDSKKLGDLMSNQPVDEDLYKIPSDLLVSSKRKKMLGFFSRCVVPPCAA